MTDASAPPRPRQVTFSAALIMLGSVLVILTVFERIAGLQSLETQQSVERFLSEPPGDGLGIGVQGVLDILRVLAMVAGGCAAAAAVLGYSVLQRSRGARIALSVLAVPLFVSGMVTGGFMSSVVVASAVMLWFQPARDWFDGVTREPRREPGRETARPAAGSAPGSHARGRDGAGPDAQLPGGSIGAAGATRPTGATDARHRAAPPAYPGFGAPSAPEHAPGAGWPPAPPVAGFGARAGVRRPRAVLTACVLTWVMSSLAVVMMAVSVAVLASSPGRVYDELLAQSPELADQGVSERLLVDVTYVLGGIVIVWSLVAIALALLVFRRIGWARPALMASAGLAGLLCLLAVAVGQALVLIPLAACVATVALLARPEATAWYRP